MKLNAASPTIQAIRTPATPMATPTIARITSSSRTPSDRITTPSAGSVSRPLNGGATNAADREADDDQRRRSALLTRLPNRKRRRGLEKRSMRRMNFSRPLMNFSCLGAVEGAVAEALGQPQLPAADEQLQREEDDDDLEDVRRRRRWAAAARGRP